MLRKTLAKNMDHDPDFRWRGTEVTRLENLSDIVFALALGMLILSGSPPETMSELNQFLLSIIPAAAGFAILIGIWQAHFTFFRRYGLGDKRIIFLNAILLFAVLFVAYPLKFAFDSLFGFFMALSGDDSLVMKMELAYDSAGLILTYFGLGYAFIHGLFVLMQKYALKKKDVMALNEKEITLTKRQIFEDSGMIIIALTVANLAFFTPLFGFAGFIMFFAFLLPLIGKRRYPLT